MNAASPPVFAPGDAATMAAVECVTRRSPLARAFEIYHRRPLPEFVAQIASQHCEGNKQRPQGDALSLLSISQERGRATQNCSGATSGAPPLTRYLRRPGRQPAPSYVVGAPLCGGCAIYEASA